MNRANSSTLKTLHRGSVTLMVLVCLTSCAKEERGLPERLPYQLDLSKLTITSIIEDSVLIMAASRDESVVAEWLGVQGILRAKSEAGKLQFLEWYTNTSDSAYAQLRGGADMELARRGGKMIEANDHAARWSLGASVVSLSRVQRLTSLVIGPEQSLSLSEFRLGQPQAEIVRILKEKQLEPEFVNTNLKEPWLRVKNVKFLDRTGTLRIDLHPNRSLRQVSIKLTSVEPSEYESLLERLHDSLKVVADNRFDEGMDYTYFFRGDTVHSLNFYLGTSEYLMFDRSEGI